MLEPYAAVVIFSPAEVDYTPPEAQTEAIARITEPAFCVVAHNLNKWDAHRLADRLAKQYDLSAHVIFHRNRHDGEITAPAPQPQDCSLCRMLFGDVVERALTFARSKAANTVVG